MKLKFIFLFLIACTFGWGQVTILNENMYNGTGGSNGNAISDHETNNRFNEDALTYSGTGDMRTTNASSGYTDYSGTWNVLLNPNGSGVTETFVIDGINAASYSNLLLSFGIKKATNASNGSELKVQYSTTGNTGPFTDVSWGVLPTGSGTINWVLRNSSSPIPSNITTIRFVATNYSSGFNIDDVKLVGDLACTATNLTFLLGNHTVNEGDPNFTRTATSDSPGAVSYTSSNPTVASVNASSGEVDVLSAGTTTITATQVADGSYCAATATYTLTVNSTTPVITPSGSITAMTTTYGSVSANQNFTFTASNLSGSNVTVTPPAGFEVASAAAGPYASTVNYVVASGSASGTVYIRLAAITDAGTYSGSVTLSDGTTNASVNVPNSVVNPKNLTITGISINNKVYDGTTSAIISGTATLSGVVGADDVNLSGTPTANFNNKNVGTNKAVTISGYSLSGTDAGNYMLSQPSGLQANITKKNLSVSGATAQNKVYDGTTSATITGATLVGVISPDVVTVSGGGSFADANVGTNKTVTANLTLGGADNGNYNLIQPTGLTADITKANPVFTTSTINLSVGGTYSLPGANISSTSNGTYTYSITGGGFASYDGSVTLTGVAVGTETLTINQTATTNYNAGSTTVQVVVSLVTYSNGDFRSIQATGLSYNSGWEYYDGSSWGTPPGGKGPENSSATINNIYIDHYVDGGGNATKAYSCNFIINSGGSLNLMDNAANPTDHFIAANKKLEVKSGGELYISGDISINATGNLIVRNGGSFVINGDVRIGDELWNGVELFEGGSTVTINEWGWNGVGSGSLLNTYGQISDNANGYKFGNLIIDAALTNSWTLVGGNTVVKLTENNLELYNETTNSAYFITGTSNTNSGFTVGGDFIIYDGPFYFGTNFSNGNQSSNYTIKGDFINISDDALKLHHMNGSTTGNPSGNVTVEGNVEIEATVQVSNDGDKKLVLDTGTAIAPKFIDIAANVVKINLDVNSGYRRLKQDLVLGTNSKVIVKNNATLDFGFDNDNSGTTPLVLRRFNNDASQTGQSFELQNGGTIKITSPLGVSVGGTYTGNVQVGTAGSRTFGADAIYHYIGKANQVTGNGLPNGASNKHLIVELNQNELEFSSDNGIIRFNNPSSANGSNFKGFEIRKGIVVSDNTNRFEDSSNSGEKGNLKMTGGEYRISAKDTQPSLSGVYELNLPSKIIFTLSDNVDTQSIRGGDTYQYANIDITGTAVNYNAVNINMKANTLFKIKSNAILTNDGAVGQILSLDDGNKATLEIESNGTFVTKREKGFYGPVDGINPAPSVRDNVLVNMQDGSLVEYTRNGDQIVTSQLFGTAPNQYSYKNLRIHDNTPNQASIEGVVKVAQGVTISSTGKLLVKETTDVSSSNVLYANKGITVASGGEANFANNAQLMQDADAVNSGNINMKRKFIFSKDRLQYNFIISPVKDQKIKPIYPGAPFVIYHKESANWFYNAYDGAYIVGRGLAIKEATLAAVPNDITPDDGTPYDASFTGEPFNAGATFQLKYTSTSAPNAGYNLVGNPYPSNLDLEELYETNKTLIEPTFKFWDNRGNSIYQQEGSTYGGSNYAYYNALSGTGVGSGVKAGGASGAVRIPNQMAKVGTAFMIRALSGANNQNLVFNNGQRKTDLGETFFGKGNFTQRKDRFWLTLKTPDDLELMTAVVYIPNGTNNFSLDDSTESGASDNLFTLADGQKLSIQGRSPFVVEDIVPLGIRAFEPGRHVISLFKAEGIFEDGQTIYLFDKKKNYYHNLSQDEYKFDTAEGEYNNRFEIVYESHPTFHQDPSVIYANMEVRKVDHNIQVLSSISKLKSIEIYDLNAKLIYKKENVNVHQFEIKQAQFAKQLLIVKVQTVDGVVLSEKLMND